MVTNIIKDKVFNCDGLNASCAGDFAWPEGAEVRGNVNLANQEAIYRDEVEADWDHETTRLLARLETA